MMTSAHHQTVKGEVAYGVIAGVMWIIWMAAILRGYFSSKGTSGETGEKALGHSDTGGSSPDRYSVQCKDA